MSILEPDNLQNNVVEVLGLSQIEMQEFFISLGEPSFRASQFIKWLHHHQVTDFDLMLNLSKKLRSQLKSCAEINIPTIVTDQTAYDGTRKWLLELSDGNKIETVFIPSLTRSTLCISSQVGCSLNCSFCYTAQQGYNRNLTAAEIIAQLWLAKKIITSKITNVVIMGMGEPLLNFEPIISALELMLNDYGYGLSKRKVTLSTSGIVPKIYQLRHHIDVSLAVSLHAPNDELRNQLVPINKKYPLVELIQACKDYTSGSSKNHVTFEYVLLKDINDSIKHAKQLINLVKNVACKINLIPFNPFPSTKYQTSSPAVAAQFQAKLMSAGINTIIRRTRGEDIAAACGQLAGDITDRTKRSFKIRQAAI